MNSKTFAIESLHASIIHIILICIKKIVLKYYNIQMFAWCMYVFIYLSLNRPSTYHFKKSATEHSSTCKSHSHITTGLVPISYRGALLSTLLHVSLIPTSHNRPSTYQLQRSATEHSSTCKSHSHKPQQA
jgi:hypothetical protein